MKQSLTILLFITSLSFSSNLFSQTDYPFPSQDAHWFTDYNIINGFGFGHFDLCGDTIIDNVKYSILNSYTLYLGAIRVEEEKVYWLGQDNELTLMYDFGLEVGDFFQMKGMMGNPLSVVVSEISNQLINGEVRKTIHFEGQTFYWIEGIGGTQLSFWPLNNSMGGFGTLHCFADEGNAIYSLDNGLSCDNWFETLPECEISTNTEETTPRLAALKIAPNPFSDYLSIELPNGFEGKNLVWQIIPASGANTPLLSSVFTNKNAELDLSNLPTGIYFLNIRNPQTGERFTEKLLKF